MRGYLVWMNLPWVVMGVGCTIGGIPSASYIFGAYWLFFKGGAGMLVRYPGVFNRPITSPRL